MREKKKLIALGAELYRLGIKIEASKTHFKELVEIGMPYNSDEVTSAVLRLQFLQAQWAEGEAAYLQLRENFSSANEKNILC